MSSGSPNNNRAENVLPLDEFRERAIKDALSLYCLELSNDKFAHFAQDVIFEDQFVYVQGLSKVKAVWHALNKLVSKASMESYSIIYNNDDIVRIDLNVRNTIRYLNSEFKYHSVCELEFKEDKVVKMVDKFYGYGIKNEGLGSGVYRLLRKANGTAVSTIVSALGG